MKDSITKTKKAPKRRTLPVDLPVTRRQFLKMSAGGLICLSAGVQPAKAATYRVGVGVESDPYAATTRAIDASDEWPSRAICNKKVVIKPNLVTPATSETGTTTDPEVVRAIVDRALMDGATETLIIESGFRGANFSPCGYDRFIGYDSRVRLVDLGKEVIVPTPVPNGMTYQSFYLPEILISEDIIFISAGKLKTHFNTLATLSVKNMVGLAPFEKYCYPNLNWLFALHLRSIDQAIVDINLTRPIDYAVVDGVWAMEGQGPGNGDPVEMNMVLAGRNCVAVDRVCLSAMQLPQMGAQHLNYMARCGLGPQDLAMVETTGDQLIRKAFKRPNNIPPILEYPRAFPPLFRLEKKKEITVFYGLYFPCMTRLEIVRFQSDSPRITTVRVLHDWRNKPAGYVFVSWDGKNDQRDYVQPGTYGIWLRAKYTAYSNTAYATGRFWVA
jgi:uncharacterized protein (DUF362 family)